MKRFSTNIQCPLCQVIMKDSKFQFMLFKNHLIKYHKFELWNNEFTEAVRMLFSSLPDNPSGYCQVCGAKTEFVKNKMKFDYYCCKEHKAIGIANKIKETSLERYGVPHVSQTEEFQSKRELTCQERYGGNSPMASEEIKNKIKATNLEKYGCENPLQNEIVKNKMFETNIKRYGGKTTSCSKEVRDKIRKSLLEHYSDEERKAISIKKKEQTCLEHFGATHPWKSEEIRNRIMISVRENHYDLFLKILKENKIEPLFNKEYYLDCHNQMFNYKCLSCKRRFETVDHYAGKVNCPYCLKTSRSFLERDIIYFLRERLYIDNIITNSRSVIYPLEIDIYLPDYKVGIEANGLHWHSYEQIPDERYHLNKTEMCKEKEVRLIQITDIEWKNKNRICKSILKSVLGKIENKIYARKCEIKEIDNNIYEEFCMMNHISGNARAKIRIGLFYKDNLVQIVGINKSRFSKDETELVRHCSLVDTTIIGGFSKLISYYVNKYNPDNLITYCDRRFFTGNGYSSTGWQLIGTTNPNYWYFSLEDYYLQSRIKFQKHKLFKLLPNFNQDLTEYENMLLNGYFRYYDCGSLKFKYQK